MDKRDLEEIVRAVVRESLALDVIGERARERAGAGADACDDGCVPRDAPPQRPRDPFEARRIVEATPARVVQGRTGTRYLTSTYIQLRAEHAIALDAVHSSVPEDWPAKHGCIALRTRCKDHAEFLLHPDLGRRLDDDSRARLLAEGTKGADVQVIAGDGLAALALLTQGPVLLPALDEALRAQGLSTGKPLFVRHARIGVADDIGVLLGSKSTAILVGERPGLGTGDSLSIYTAYKPRLGQENAEKNCISNVRGLGMPPAQAALECARLMKRSFEAGGGGLHLVRPQVVVAKRSQA